MPGGQAAASRVAQVESASVIHWKCHCEPSCTLVPAARQPSGKAVGGVGGGGGVGAAVGARVGALVGGAAVGGVAVGGVAVGGATVGSAVCGNVGEAVGVSVGGGGGVGSTHGVKSSSWYQFQ
jgi:hypothetical protein